jgi:phosphohistidine phosphatase SixA
MFATLATLALAAHIALPAQDTAQARREALMNALRSGGYSVLLRHARTDYSVQEPRSSVPPERSAQRNLSDDGVRDAALIGAVFRKYGVAFAEIIASPMFRTVETAELVAGSPRTTMMLRDFPSTPEQISLVRSAPKPGTNRLLVTHHFVIEQHVPGVRLGAVGESEAAVIGHAPDGGVRLVGILSLEDWKALANPASAALQAPADRNGHGASTAPARGATAPGTGSAVGSDSPAATLAREYIAAFNSGDADRMRAFILTSMAPNPERSTDERVASYLKLYEENGTLSVVGVDSSSTSQVTLQMQSKRGAFTLAVRTSENDPSHTESISFAFTSHSR